jgi:hypothetical protein
MTLAFSVFRPLALAAVLIAAAAGLALAQAQVYVLESTADGVKVGTAYGLGERITIPAGSSIRAVMPSGKTQTIKGPYSGPVADLAKGQKSNEGVVAWIKNLLQTGGSTERVPGATRGMRPGDPPASFSWTVVPAAVDSTFCAEKGAKLQLRRAASPKAERLILINQGTAERAEVEFAAGSTSVAWPAALPLRADATYALVGGENPARRQMKLRVLDSLPGDEDVLAELAARDCKHQFEAWVKEKVAAGKRKAS